MKKLISVLVIFFSCFGISGQSFTFPDLNEGSKDVDGFIEKLIDKGFIVVEKEITDSTDYTLFAWDYNKNTDIALTWAHVSREDTRYIINEKEVDKEEVLIILKFFNPNNYNYLIKKIKQNCDKYKFEYDEKRNSYVNHYDHADSVYYKFYKNSDGNFIEVCNYLDGQRLLQLLLDKQEEKNKP